MPLQKNDAAPFPQKLAYILICCIAVGYIAVIASEIIIPLIFALLISILLLPVSQWVEKRLNFPRGVASFFTLIFFASIIVLIVYLVGSQIGNLASDWPLFKDQLNTSLTSLQNWVSDTFHYDLEKQKAYINNAASNALSSGSSIVGSTLLSVSSILLFTVLTLIYTFFLLLYRSVLLKFLIALVNDENNNVVHDVVSNIQLVIRKYILGLLLEMLIVASMCWLSFGILGIKYFILLGLITALFNIIPYVGIFTALLLCTIITFATTGASAHLLLVVITIVAVHLIDSNILLPFIVGSKVSINAMITVIGVVAGEMLWGVPGMFLSVPVIAMLKIICDRIEPLKPWAILLGHEKAEKKLKKFAVRKKQTIKKNGR
ncbi:MAG: AI-2E family transporter [Parafilimonas sp.]|nr:AI-2E family transporter [Parafilimonas sp.]